MKQLISLLFGLGCLIVVNAQQNQIRFKQLTANSGLSQGHVLCMLQDRKGYIWAGTYNGLNRYNGYNFEVFYSEPGNPNSLAINVVFRLFEDHEGKIWCGTWGVDVYDPETETIIKHIPAETGPNSISAGEISGIQEDANGIMWFGTRNGGLNKYDPQTGNITWFRGDYKNKDGIQSYHINNILADKKGYLWIATEGGGLSRMNIKDESITTFRQNDLVPGSLLSDNITCVFEDRGGIMWFGDSEGSLLKYSDKYDCFTRIYSCNENGDPKKIRIMQIAQDLEGKLLLATNGMGLIEFDPESKKSVTHLHISTDAGSLASNEIWSVLVTKTNSVFVGSYGRGLSDYSPYNNKFDVFTIMEPTMQGRESNAFTDAIEDKNGNLVTGTYNGFLVFNQKTWNYTHYLPGSTYEENKILTLALAPDGSIWLTSPKCLYRYDKDFKKIATYVLDPKLLDQSIYALTFDYKENLWIGLFNKGLLKIKKEEWKNRKKTVLDFKLYLSHEDDTLSISSNQHWIIYTDADSNLWIGGLGGIDRYNYATDNFNRIFQVGTVKTIDRDSNGTLWLGTIGNGLYSYDLKTLQKVRYTPANGLSHSFIYGVLADNFNNLWITSEGGLSRLNITSGEFRHFDKRDGLPDDHFDDKSESKLSDGRFYLGTNNGFVIFRPEKITDDTSKSTIVLTSLFIDNKKILKYSDKRSQPHRDIPISMLKNIDLEPGQRDIEFRFASMHFASPHKIKYSYILKGYDKDWIYTDSYKREAKYTNLEGGKYVFILKASNSDGKWTSDPLEINLTVHPPFYKSLVFNIFGVLLILTLIYVYFRLKLINEKKRNRVLSEKVTERTREISEKNKQLQIIFEDLRNTNSQLKEHQAFIEEQSKVLQKQRDELANSNATKDKLFSVIAHDLKAPFNVILGYNDLLIDQFNDWDQEKQLNVLLLLKESSMGAYSLLENLLQWSQSQSGTLHFHPGGLKVNDIFENVLPDITLFAKRKGIKIINQAEKENTVIFADVNMLKTIFRNLILNAIKFSNRDGHIIISATRRENHILFCVKDEGIGMEQSYADRLFIQANSKSKFGTEGEKGTGIGLILCRDFVEIHHGTIWVESELNKGTSVCFTIPVSQI
jgi:signal transduction histidine kinase/ligand-binding sensor domain-containing protein